MIMLTSLLIVTSCFFSPSANSPEADVGGGRTAPMLVRIIEPGDGFVVSGKVTVTALVENAPGGLKVEFFIGGTVAAGAEDSIPPYLYEFNSVVYADSTELDIFAKATDRSGNFAFSDTVTVMVDNSRGGSGGVILNEDFTARQVFPKDNWWNLDISTAPVDPQSAFFIDWIGAGKALHPDFGNPPYGIPYIGVPGDQELKVVTFTSYADESDQGAPGRPVGYPMPDEAYLSAGYIEGGVAGGGGSGDRHMIIVDRDNWFLFETYGTHWNSSLMRWEAASGAVFNLATNDRRPEGWTSTDAAGLAVFPGLVKYDEVYGPEEINHALRFTTRATNGYVWPASHAAGSDPNAPPLGARIRLKASVDISAYPAEIRKIFRAMKKYGLILADNGSDMFVQGTMDQRWDNGVLNPAFHSLTADDFEFVQLGWNPPGAKGK